MKALPDIKNELKEVLQEGIDISLTTLKSILADSTDKYNDLVLLEGRYREVNQQLLQGVISYENAQLEFNKIRKSLLDFIESMEENHLKGKEAPDGKPDVYNGEVLYRIPKTMQKEEEVKCVIRVAFNRQILMEGFEEEKGDVLKDIRISDVMGVELIDPESSPAFSIRTFSEPVQFVEKDLPTEWLFYVKPLREGKHSLVLKISVIEIKAGIERKRNVVLEETVVIIAEPAPQPEEGEEFSRAGYALNFAAAAAVISHKTTEGSKGPQPEMPSPLMTPAAPTRQAPQPSPATLRPGSARKMRKIAAALPILLVFIVAAWALWPYLTGENQLGGNNSTETWNDLAEANKKEALEEFIEKFPDSDEATTARQRLDSLDAIFWESALASGDTAQVRNYLDEFPGGRHVPEAQAHLNQHEAPERGGSVAAEPSAETPQVAAPETEIRVPGQPSGTTAPQTENLADVPVPMRAAFRLPVFPKCSNNNKKKEEQCTNRKTGQFISKRMEYPKEALRKRIEGTVTVTFVVERDGTVTGVKALNKIGGGCEEEAVRLVSTLPRFKPGIGKDGKPVRIQYSLPIKFVVR
jgi:TonB family protein